ncbi:MAG TPA: type I restriction enzyme HsdR N-terminal domain-containing protein [Bacteroidia bacterium]|nr:type I restriction enzyme HsdR N-terminal domain-containing protein [Bacteroidia bacterium]
MLNKSKRTKLQKALRTHIRKHFNSKRSLALGEADTRQIIDDLLTSVLGYALIDEVVSEFAVKGLKADYLVQIKGKPLFLIEAKSFATDLKAKHLNQVSLYAAKNGMEWVLVSNGRHYDLHKVSMAKSLETRKVFSIDLSDPKKLDEAVEGLQYIHRIAAGVRGLDQLWRKTIALDAPNVAGLLYSATVLNYLKRTLKTKHKRKFSDAEVIIALDRVIEAPVNLDLVNPIRTKKSKRTYS